MASTGRARGVGSVFFWSILPVELTGVASVLGAIDSLEKDNRFRLAPLDSNQRHRLAILTLVVALALMLLLIAKSIEDHVFGQSLVGARYDTVKKFHNRVGPALDGRSELALTSRSAKTQKKPQESNRDQTAVRPTSPPGRDVDETGLAHDHRGDHAGPDRPLHGGR